MLWRVEIPLVIPETLTVSPSWGSLMHGAVMELLPAELALALHDSSLKPWSQYLIMTGPKQYAWRLAALNQEMAETLDSAIVRKLPQAWQLQQKNNVIQLLPPQPPEQLTYQELARRHFLAVSVPRLHHVNFLVPTAFKTNGQLAIFPTVDLIMNSLMQRWDSCASDLSLADSDVRQHLASHIYIRDYRLASASFSVNGSWIKGFKGQVDLNVKGPDALARVAALLLDFGRFSGVGIKTALGMGGIAAEADKP